MVSLVVTSTSPPRDIVVVLPSPVPWSPVLPVASDELRVEEEPEAGTPVGVKFSIEVVEGVLARLDKAPSESVVKVVSSDPLLFSVVGPFPFIKDGFIVLEVSGDASISSLFSPMS